MKKTYEQMKAFILDQSKKFNFGRQLKISISQDDVYSKCSEFIAIQNARVFQITKE